MTASQAPAVRLPAWRLAAGLFILGSLLVALLSLGPVYLRDWQLKAYLREAAKKPEIATMTDAAIASQIAGRAHELDLPVSASDVQVTHVGAKAKIELRYVVRFQLYEVDLHFHSIAQSR